MYNVFSITSAKKPSSQLREWQKKSGALYVRTLFEGPEDEPLYMLKPGAIELLVWVNKKILYQLDSLQPKTLGVRLRIATSMLNKLVDDGVIPRFMGITYHNRLIQNTGKILSSIWVEDLPF